MNGRVIDTSVFYIQNTRSGGNALFEGAKDYFAYVPGVTFDSLPIFKYGYFGKRYFGWNEFLNDTKRRKRRFYTGHFVFGAQQHISGDTLVLTSIRKTRSRLISRLKASGGDAADSVDWIRNYWETDNGITVNLVSSPLRMSTG